MGPGPYRGSGVFPISANVKRRGNNGNDSSPCLQLATLRLACGCAYNEAWNAASYSLKSPLSLSNGIRPVAPPMLGCVGSPCGGDFDGQSTNAGMFGPMRLAPIYSTLLLCARLRRQAGNIPQEKLVVELVWLLYNMASHHPQHTTHSLSTLFTPHSFPTPSP
jgi:hypothetical protein